MKTRKEREVFYTNLVKGCLDIMNDELMKTRVHCL
jgi:hypothetical protein